MMDKVSVFVPYYNDQRYLRDCIDSILSQSYSDFELILLNHASTDDSERIAKSYSDKRIRHFALPKNLGAGGGMLLREFFYIAEGVYVKLFCADDIMCENCLSKLVCYMKDNPQVDVVFGNIEYIDKNGSLLNADWFRNRPGFNINDGKYDLLRKYSRGISVLPYVGGFAKKESFNGITLHSSFTMMLDMSIWVEMLLKNRTFSFFDEKIARYRIHQKQLSASGQLGLAMMRSNFETLAYCDVFYNHIKSIEEVQRIFNDSLLCKKLNKDDTEYIEFAIAHSFLCARFSFAFPYRLRAYQKIENFFLDDQKRINIENKFSFGIKEFRDAYSDLEIRDTRKVKMYNKHSKELNIIEILFLLIRKIWRILSFREFKVYLNSKKKKQYSI